MSKVVRDKTLKVADMRHAEYYQMQETFDDLYKRSKGGEIFTDLMDEILKEDNILLAYRNIKANAGSKTAGTDKLNIDDIGKLTPTEVVEKVRFILTGSKHGYRPKPVRRKEIPKQNGKTRPLGIPCIWDRLVQQCIKQVMEPICEAKFSEYSYGFRPQRSVEHAIQRTYFLMQKSNMHFVCEFDIKGFFDNVNHAKLIRQIWAIGIRDKTLLFIIRRILTAPIRLMDGSIMRPQKGTPQGGILSPLLANIVLNELDHWVESQWQDNPVANKYVYIDKKDGHKNKRNGYRAMRGTKLKEMYIVRYADDFRIFCATKSQAERVKIAVTKWLSDRLKLEVSPEKTRVVNANKHYMEFLGFKIKVHKKGGKRVVTSNMSVKAFEKAKSKLKQQAKYVARPRPGKTEVDEIVLYNATVMGIHNYYGIATNINLDCMALSFEIKTVLYNRLKTQKGSRLKRKGRELTAFERERYGQSKMLRFVAGSKEPIYPIGFVRCQKPMARKSGTCPYTPEGRAESHKDLKLNANLLWNLRRQPLYGRTIEYADNRLSLYCAQHGKCAITGIEFTTTEQIHCHHKTPRNKGGTDKYDNLTLVLESVHKLIHAKNEDIIKAYMEMLKLNSNQKAKLNRLRIMAGRSPI